VDFAASATQIGGLTSTPGMPPGNVISGSGVGLQVGTGSNNVTNTAVMGNLIGTDASGTNGLGNLTGITIVDPSNTIGGTDPLARNIISANGTGINLGGTEAGAQNNKVQGNFIGTDITGTQLLGNGGDGVFALAPNNTIGGISVVPGQNPGNLIAGNGGRGVHILATGIAVLGNSIHSNGSLGIELENDGVTANDPCDGDLGGNNRQNFPVITSSSSGAGMVMLSGSLDSLANSTFRLEFFSSAAGDPSGNGEGRTFLGALDNVQTNGSCIANFGPVSFPVPAGQSVVTATATRLDGSLNPIETSEFSAFVMPTAANVSVSGKVLTPDGRGLRNAVVTITDSNGIRRTVTTSSFGLYSFDNLQVGQTYVIRVSSKLYRFSSRLVQVNDTLTDVDFVGQE